MNALQFVRNIWTLKGQAEQHADANIQAQAAYTAGASLPEIIDAYTGRTSAAADDGAALALLMALGEMRNTAYNAAEILRGSIAIAEATARQLDGVVEALDHLVYRPLRDVLETPDA